MRLLFIRFSDGQDGTDAYTGPVYASAAQKPGVNIVGAAQNAMNMLNPENAANKLNEIKNETLSSIHGLTGQTNSEDGSDSQ